MPSCFHGPTVAGVQAFDRVNVTNHFPNIHVVVEEGNAFFPRVLPETDDCRVSGAPFSFNDSKASRAAFGLGAV